MNKLKLIFYGQHPKQEFWPVRTQLFNLQIKPEIYNDRTKGAYNPSGFDNWVNITFSLVSMLRITTATHKPMIQDNQK